jgi:hypothetical protein
MTPERDAMCIAMLGLNQNGAARFFGLGERTSRR